MPFLAVLLIRAHHASPAVAGAVVAAFGAATIPSRLLGGFLAQWIGTKRAVLAGLLGTAAAQLMIAAVTSLPATLFGAMLLGLAFEIYEPSSQALIADATPQQLLPRAYGLLGATLAVAGVAAGLIAAAAGRIGLRWLFVIDALTGFACGLIVAIWMPASHSCTQAANGEKSRPLAPLATPWRDRRLLLLMVTGTAFATSYMTIPMAIPLGLAAAGRPPSDAGLIQALGALVIAAAQPLFKAGQRIGARIMAGHGLIAAGSLVAAAIPSLGGYAAAMSAISLGDALLLGYSYTLVASIAPEGKEAAYFAAYGLTWGIALTLGPVMMGELVSRGLPPYWIVTSAAMASVGIAQSLLARHLERSAGRA